ncbi:MAG: type II secretion system F family protein [Alphaproteobacteria bacterium]|jgi:tight adherence protein B|nr:type II secretion system F family protein [Thalassospira sp.]MCE2964711.1 type II secretion system F family protein [Alphaproteobacteria bacterium]
MNMQTLIIFGCLATGLLLVAYLVGQLMRNQDGRYKKRIKNSITTRKTGTAIDDKDIASITLNSGPTEIDDLLKVIKVDPIDMQTRLKKADLKLKVQEYFILSLMLGIGVASIMILTIGLPLIAGVGGGLVAAIFLPKMYVDGRIEKRTATFNRLLPDALDIMVRGLRTGLPLSECMRSVAKDAPHPVNEEFARIRDDMKLGIELGDAVRKMAERLNTQELNFFSIAISIQADTGGNLTENLENLSDVLRKRQQIYRMIKAKSAEAVWTGRILAALPFLVIGAIQLTSPQYLVVMYTNTTGIIISIGSFLWLMFGLFTMRRMTRFDF